MTESLVYTVQFRFSYGITNHWPLTQ